jgi:B12-binding domain/radical SAM domain protein
MLVSFWRLVLSWYPDCFFYKQNMQPVSLMLYRTRRHKNSFTALAGALETQEYLGELDLSVPSQEKQLVEDIMVARQKGRRPVVCISFFSPFIQQIAALVNRLKKTGPKLLLFAGGPHATGDPEGTLAMGFDAVVPGEGEAAFTELIERIVLGQDFSTVAGLVVPDGTGCRFTGARPQVKLDAYPPFSVLSNIFGPVEITRGCPFACGFCQTTHIFSGRVRHRGIDAIARAAEALRQHNRHDIRFLSPNAFSYGSADGRLVNLTALEDMLQAVAHIMGPRGRLFVGSFPSEVRPEHVMPETMELARRYGGNDNIVIGAQSGSPRMLDLCRRSHTVEDIYQAAGLILKAGFKCYVDFIFGLPEETEEDIAQTLRVMEDIAGMGAQIHLHTFMPLPGTLFSERPAGAISAKTHKILNRFSSTGRAFGGWQQKPARSF